MGPSDPQERTVSSIRRRDVLKYSGVASIAGLAGCSGLTGSDGDETLKFGVLTPNSGIFGYVGGQQRPAVELAIEEFNESDDLLPDTEIEYVHADTAGDPQEALDAARELMDIEEVDHILGPSFSTTGNSVRGWIKDQEAINMMFGAGPAFLTDDEECTHKFFRPNPDLIGAGRVAAQHGVENFGEDVFILYMDYAFGESLLAALEENIADAGGSVVEAIPKPPSSEDYSDVINAIENSDPDWVYHGMAGGGAVPFYTQAASADINVPMHFSVTSDQLGQLTPEQFGRLGEQHAIVIYSNRWERGTNESFINRYEEKTDTRPPLAAASGYNGTEAIVQMIHEAGGPGASIEELVTAGRGLSFTSICGDLTIRECNHMGLYPYGAIEVTGVEGGSPEVETHESYPAEDFVAPCDEIACEHEM